MENKKEMNFITAIPILFCVLFVLWFFSLNAGLEESITTIGNYLMANGGAFAFVFAKVGIIYALSIFWIIGLVGFNEFGKKISHFSEKKKKTWNVAYISSVVAGFLVGWYSAGYFTLYSLIEPLPSIIPSSHLEVIEGSIAVAQGLSSSLLVIFGYWLIDKLDLLKFGKIDELPKDRNKLIIGTKIENNRESWITLGPKSLATGILTTASTGSGKSSACLLPWTKQILTNFEPRPSVIVIDPKDSFAKDVLKLTKELGLE